ncbi:MAG: NADPH dehydrogenase, partial [Clostridia bacterium]
LTGIVSTVHAAGSRIAVQIGHGGRKAWAGGEAIVAPSALPFSQESTVPQELTVEEIESIVRKFQDAAKRAVKAGYDAVEIHGAHGYLIHQFISPNSNKRKDKYGGSAENRIRFPLAVIKAVKSELPETMPLLMRISAVEYVAGGYIFEEMLEIARAFRDAGVDILNVSTGGASPAAPEVWPGYQLPYAERIKRELQMPVIGCGLITTGNMAEEAVANERVDLIAVGRGLLADPHWPLTAAKDLGISGVIPQPYKRAYPENIR